MNFDGYAEDPKVINFKEAVDKRKTEDNFFEKEIVDDEEFYFDQAHYEAAVRSQRDYINYTTGASMIGRSKDRAIKRIESMQHVLFFTLLLNSVILFTLWLINI